MEKHQTLGGSNRDPDGLVRITDVSTPQQSHLQVTLFHHAIELLWIISAWIPACRPPCQAMCIEESNDRCWKENASHEAHCHEEGQPVT